MDYQQLITGIDTSAAPACAEVNGKILFVWKGEGDDVGLWFTVTTSATPAPSITDKYSFTDIQSRVGSMSTSANPSLATMGNVAYLAYRSSSGNGICWASYENGVWTDLHLLSFGGTSHGTACAPSITSDGKALYITWIDSDSGEIGWATSTDGKTWGTQQQVTAGNTGGTPATDAAPAIAILKQEIHIAWKGRSDGFLYWSYFSNGNWSPQTSLKSSLSDGPSLAVDGDGYLFLAWKGAGVDTGVYYKKLTSDSQKQWSDQVSRYGMGTSTQPAMVSTGNEAGMMLAWRGEGNDSGIYYGPLMLPP